MSRRNPSPGEVLVTLPWQISASLAVISYIGLRWGLPAFVHPENPFFKALVPALANLAWIPAAGFSIVAVFAALFARRKRELVDTQTSLETLRAQNWKDFEWLVGEAYRRQGYVIEESLGGGADGGVDIVLRKGGARWLVQCKQWRARSVGAPVVREIYGLVAHHQAAGAMVITSGDFTRDAQQFAEGKNLKLIDGRALLSLVKSVQSPIQQPQAATVSVAAPATPPAAPVCPDCASPMVRRTARKGPNSGNQFWGCSTYPTCRGVRSV